MLCAICTYKLIFSHNIPRRKHATLKHPSRHLKRDLIFSRRRFHAKSNAAPVTARLCPSPSAARSGMLACATGLGLDMASAAAARAPDDRRGLAAFVSRPAPRPTVPFDRSTTKDITRSLAVSPNPPLRPSRQARGVPRPEDTAAPSKRGSTRLRSPVAPPAHLRPTAGGFLLHGHRVTTRISPAALRRSGADTRPVHSAARRPSPPALDRRTDARLTVSQASRSG